MLGNKKCGIAVICASALTPIDADMLVINITKAITQSFSYATFKWGNSFR